jgi:LPXTG-motif cell wall-anchored protein
VDLQKAFARGDTVDTTTLLIIVIVVLLLGGGGWYGRGRWF